MFEGKVSIVGVRASTARGISGIQSTGKKSSRLHAVGRLDQVRGGGSKRVIKMKESKKSTWPKWQGYIGIRVP